MFTESASLDLVFYRFWSIRIVQVLVGDIIDKPTMNHGEWMMVGGCTGHEPQDCWLESDLQRFQSQPRRLTDQPFFFFGGHGRAPPFLYHGRAPYHYTQRHQSHWAWKNSTSLALDPTTDRLPFCLRGTWRLRLLPRCTKWCTKSGVNGGEISLEIEFHAILDDQIYQGFVFFCTKHGGY